MQPEIQPEIQLEPFVDAALKGLREMQKAIPPKYLYDQKGSSLFEEICRQPEYYPTRTEIGILRAHIDEIVAEFSERAILIEPGSGASIKTEILLDRLIQRRRVRAYLPLDISRDFLLLSVARLEAKYPGLEIIPVCADFTAGLSLPEPTRKTAKSERVAFLPGSTLGNFDPPDALDLLSSVSQVAGRFLVGIDLHKDPELLESAYNDAAGVTARFNKNILTRLAREAGASLDPDDFVHEAFYRDSMRRIEMHLVARRRVRLRIAGEEFRLSPGESIHTESSYKYTVESFGELVHHAGFEILQRWTDSEGWFGVFMLG